VHEHFWGRLVGKMEFTWQHQILGNDDAAGRERDMRGEGWGGAYPSLHVSQTISSSRVRLIIMHFHWKKSLIDLEALSTELFSAIFPFSPR